MNEEIVTLDVGSTVFKVGKPTLLKCEFFSNVFEDVGSTNEPLFIDRCGHIFKHVLGCQAVRSYKRSGRLCR